MVGCELSVHKTESYREARAKNRCVSCYMKGKVVYSHPAAAFGAKSREEWQEKILSQGTWWRCTTCGEELGLDAPKRCQQSKRRGKMHSCDGCNKICDPGALLFSKFRSWGFLWISKIGPKSIKSHKRIVRATTTPKGRTVASRTLGQDPQEPLPKPRDSGLCWVKKLINTQQQYLMLLVFFVISTVS